VNFQLTKKQLIQNLVQSSKKKYIPPILRREAITGSAVAESDAGSDIFGVTTSAAKDGDQAMGNSCF
jgi:alkylation response protein AidB-like acyl-CoA dehydrogenase